MKAVASTGLVGQIVAALRPQVLNPLLVRPGPVSKTLPSQNSWVLTWKILVLVLYEG